VSDVNDNVKRLLEKITSAKFCTALTGAGVSTLSGIRDFRGKNGLYNDARTSADAEKIFDFAHFENEPEFFYRAARSFIYNLDEKTPSVVHEALAELERRGVLRALITQNIDLLHTKAGSRRVMEIHGSPAVHYCLRCAGVRMPFEEAARHVNSGGFPRCPHCARILKPAITFFGESLPHTAFREAVEAAQQSDFMLVLGTSLTVFPAASIPQYVLANGGELAIVNDQPTALDRAAALRFSDLAEVFGELRDLMQSE
jgi:NAD-dependent deacetylase